MFRALAATLIVPVISISAAHAQSAQLQRGEYLVNAVMACDGCHSPRGPAGFNMQRRFSGGMQVWDEPAFLVRGSNISQDPETGIGAWSEADIKRALVDGVRPNGVPLAPQMPFPFYKVMTPSDLDAVAAYIKAATPVKNEVVPPVYKAPMNAELIPGGEASIGSDVPRDPVRRGFYLATLAHCMECHARKPDGTHDYKAWLGKGGHEMKGPFGSVTVSNITSHKEKGIGSWSDAEIRTALTEGKGRDGRAFKQPMARHIYFSKMTPDDIDAIIAWVRTIPPLE
jgi:mono/diheme cytochrome c family protein